MTEQGQYSNDDSATDDSDDLAFAAMTTATVHLYRVLNAMRPKRSKMADRRGGGDQGGELLELDTNEFVIVSISAQGLAFSIGEMHLGLARLYIDHTLFSNYEFSLGPDGSVSFKVQLDRLITCLQMFAFDSISDHATGNVSGKETLPSHTCRMVYKGEGHPFILIFRQGANLITTCELTTLSMDDDAEVNEEALRLDLANIVLQVIMPGKIVAEAFSELATMGTKTLTIRASNSEPRFALMSHSKLGVSQFAFPNEKHILQVFQIHDNAAAAAAAASGKSQEDGELVVMNSYDYDKIMKAYDAICLASRISLRCDVNGFMSIQSMYEVGDGRSIFIDFRFATMEESDFDNFMVEIGK